MRDAVDTFIGWVVETPLSLFVQTNLWVIPTLQTLHILCIAVVIAAAAMLNLRLLGLIMRDEPLTAIVRRFLPSAWIAVAVLAVSGTLLLIAEPARSILAFPFQLKMLMLAAVIVLTVVTQRHVASHAAAWDGGAATAPSMRATAVVSMALWLAIIVAGRWIAYAESV